MNKKITAKLYATYSYEKDINNHECYAFKLYNNNGYVDDIPYIVKRKYGQIDDDKLNKYIDKDITIYYTLIDKKYTYVDFLDDIFKLYFRLSCFVGLTPEDKDKYIVRAILYDNNILYIDENYISKFEIHK